MKAFFVAGIGIAAFIEILLVSKKNKSDSDKVLTLWMFLVLFHMFLFYLYYTEAILDVPFLLGMEHPLPLLHGVLLFLYVSFVTQQLPEKRVLLLLHFLPALAAYLYLVNFFLLSSDQKIEIYRNQGAGFETFMVIKSYAISFSGIFYVIWSELLLRKHERNIREQFSNLEKVDLHWLRILTYGLGCIWLLVIFTEGDTVVFTGVVVFVFLIGFFGVRQADIFAHPPQPVESIEQKEKYQKSGLTEDVSSKLHQSLRRLMTENTPYKNSELSIDDLAAKLGVHANHLSQVINQKEKKNFYDFVNSYRIEEFKRLLSLPQNRHLTLLSLAFDCGFNSKTSFNRYFKKATGQTPSQYFIAVTGNQPAA